MLSLFTSHLTFWLTSTASSHTLCLLLSFFLSSLVFCLAIQRPVSSIIRHILTFLHILGSATAITLTGIPLTPFQHLLIPAILSATLQTVYALCVERTVVQLDSRGISTVQRFRAILRASANIRRLYLQPKDNGSLEMNAEGQKDTKTRVRFAALRGIHAMSFFLLHQFGTSLVTKALLHLHITLSDFGFDKQGLWPSTTPRDLFLRAVVSSQWIWSTYFPLVGAHDLLAVVFVSVLGWDRPDEWPPLFGSIWDATSLRRFWGVFWHRLHVPLFDAYISSVLDGKHRVGIPPACQQPGPTLEEQPPRHRLPQNMGSFFRGLRALCIFCMSAACHAVTNWVVTRRANAAAEFRFFLSNYGLCLVETVFERGLFKQGKEQRRITARFAYIRRLVGYIWVSAVIFALTPAWQYSLVRSVIGI